MSTENRRGRFHIEQPVRVTGMGHGRIVRFHEFKDLALVKFKHVPAPIFVGIHLLAAVEEKAS